ncbi:uncharacterized protein [Atheta coriaria]|uniref:uncharacterized protein n=1 Tax=Dalotia coriaria TaxID=877792 RepID=UPI0031F3D0B0
MSYSRVTYADYQAIHLQSSVYTRFLLATAFILICDNDLRPKNTGFRRGVEFGIFAQSVPLDFDDLEFGRDSQIVQSLIREVRAAPEHVQELVNQDTQKAFLHKYNDGEGDNQGYHKRSQDEDGKGYKHFDSYHKKDGDKYGFQHETSYGLENKDEGAASAQSGKYAHDEEAAPQREEENGKLRQEAAKSDEEEVEGDDDDGAETKNTYKVVEDVGEDYDSGAGSSGNYDEAADTGHYEESSDGGDEGGHYTEGGDSGDYSESEGYTNDEGDGDGESEHYETAEEEDDDY